MGEKLRGYCKGCDEERVFTEATGDGSSREILTYSPFIYCKACGDAYTLTRNRKTGNFEPLTVDGMKVRYVSGSLIKKEPVTA